ncbi:hypothetical protein PHLCEN_2v7731, partial [Hermanssonia centrifuga]
MHVDPPSHRPFCPHTSVNGAIYSRHGGRFKLETSIHVSLWTDRISIEDEMGDTVLVGGGSSISTPPDIRHG